MQLIFIPKSRRLFLPDILVMIYDDEMTKVAITANYVKRMLSILDGISLEEISGAKRSDRAPRKGRKNR